MKSLIIYLLSFACFSAFCQTDTSRAMNKEDRISIGINVSPDLCFRKIKNNDGSASSNFIINSRNKMETTKLGYTFGFNVNYKINNLITFEVGIQYSNKGFQTKMQDLAGQPGPDEPIKAKLIYSYYYFDLPFKTNFAFGNGKIQILSSAGIATNIFIRETSKSIEKYSNGKTKIKTYTTHNDINKINISPEFGVGINWRIKKRISLRIEPIFRYGVLKIIDDPVTGYLWSAGLNFGSYYRL